MARVAVRWEIDLARTPDGRYEARARPTQAGVGLDPAMRPVLAPWINLGQLAATEEAAAAEEAAAMLANIPIGVVEPGTPVSTPN